jgi:hypothetical protein
MRPLILTLALLHRHVQLGALVVLRGPSPPASPERRVLILVEVETHLCPILPLHCLTELTRDLREKSLRTLKRRGLRVLVLHLIYRREVPGIVLTLDSSS